MWRIFSGIPRAIRQHWNGPRAAAGIYKEEETLCDCEPPISCVHTRQNCISFERSQDRSDESGKDTDREQYDWWKRPHPNFWSLFTGSHCALEAVTWGAAVVLGIKLSHLRIHGVRCVPDDEKRERTKRCLLYHIAFALPGSQTTKSVLDSKTPLQNDAKRTDAPEETDPVTKVMTEFKNICSKYTAIGKNIMGLTKARDGNMESAVEDLTESSELGHTGAQFNTGLCFELGQGVNSSLAQAAKFYSQAAAKDHPEALYNLAMLYLKGEGGVAQDTSRALSLLERAAHQGLTQAQIFLGVYYTEEEKEDMEKAVIFFNMAAEQDDPEAQYFLGICYEQGWGVEMNECKAASLYSAASRNGHDGAMYNLGVFHEYGFGGLPKDRVSALDLFSQSASLGNESAYFKLQEWYANAALLEWSAKFERHANPLLDGPSVATVTKSQPSEQAMLPGFNSSASLPSLTTQVCCPQSNTQSSLPLSPSVSSPTLSDLVKRNINQLSIGHQFLSGFTKSATENFILGQFFTKSKRAEPKASFFLGDECEEARETTVIQPLFDIPEGHFCTTGLNRTHTMTDLVSVACP
ncbi:uncharacterized protein LOC121374193 [Gigantopelta aegis]|uniref:uncharacterized protein LOC121374193 n=1 Tax=Gigantopelta aegis TaxID=1735272 RepID=UPI001B88C267|nr:uncharacterized protein LOC121374193 [Gigantopelta aegis]